MEALISKYANQIESIATYCSSRGVIITEENFRQVLQDWNKCQADLYRNLSTDENITALKARLSR